MRGCEGYEAIAAVYDKLNAEINYENWADFFEKCFSEYLKDKPEIILDLACGTGRMTRTLAARGYDMIGVDGSDAMLSEAYMQGGEGILYLLQDMRGFELYGTVGAVVCCLDSINYLTEDNDLSQCFKCVHNYLDPDGLFIFDVNSPYKFRKIYGNNSYIFEDEILDSDGDPHPVYCGWQNFFDEESRLCDFYLSVFYDRGDGAYAREDEEQTERCYEISELKDALEGAGFEVLSVGESLDSDAISPETERVFVVARCKK